MGEGGGASAWLRPSWALFLVFMCQKNQKKCVNMDVSLKRKKEAKHWRVVEVGRRDSVVLNIPYLYSTSIFQ